MLRDRDPGRRARLACWLVPALLLPGLARAECGLPQRRGELQVCVVEPLRIGSVAAPGSGLGSVTITPDGERYSSFGVEEVGRRHDDHRPAELLIRGEPHRRFVLRFGGDPALSDFTTDLGGEAELDGNGERLVRVGATLAVGPRNAGEVARRFTVTAQPRD